MSAFDKVFRIFHQQKTKHISKDSLVYYCQLKIRPENTHIQRRMRMQKFSLSSNCSIQMSKAYAYFQHAYVHLRILPSQPHEDLKFSICFWFDAKI